MKQTGPGMMAISRVVPRDAGWFGPYGKFRTLFASIGWPYAEKTAAWCVNGRTVERDRIAGIKEATASPTPHVVGLIFLLVTSALLAIVVG